MSKEKLNQLREQAKELANEIYKLEKEEKLDKIKKNKEYLGKCFKVDNREGGYEYLKVISEISQNEYFGECLVFEYPFKYDFKRNCSLQENPYPKASLTFNSVRVSPKPVFSPSSTSILIEVTNEEYQEKLTEVCKRIVEFSNIENLSKEILDK